MLSLNRRHFLATAAVGATMLRPWSRVMGANEDIRVVVIGVNGIGKTHINGFPEIPGVRLVGLCDVDSTVLGAQKAAFDKKHGGSIKTYEDIRAVYDDPTVDAVVLAVPNHWHGIGTVWGCQAGKDVYVEKPCSHNIWEAQQMMKAADKHKKIVQVGIQRRSFPALKEFFQEVHEGVLGEVKAIRGLFLSRRASIGKPTAPIKPPAGVNHDLWSGPAKLDIPREKYHYDWHWFWETGNGELGNNGPHILDLARWAAGAKTLPSKTVSLGGRYVWDDNGETPNTHTIRYDYDDAPPIIFDITNLPTATGKSDREAYRGISFGIVIEGDKGSYVGFDNGVVYDPDGNKVREIKGPTGPDGGRQYHRENFIKAVRSRNAAELNCGILDGHLASSLCHLGNISQRLSEKITFPQLAERVQQDSHLTDSVGRITKHLSANGVQVDSATVELGATLKLDPKTETFADNPAANALLTREFRAPFTINVDA